MKDSCRIIVVALLVLVIGCANPLRVSVRREDDGTGVPNARVMRVKSELGFPYFMGPVQFLMVEGGITDANGDLVLKDRDGMQLRVEANGFAVEHVSLGAVPAKAYSVTVRMRAID